MAIVGEDSGANLALNVALRARDEGVVQPRHIGLVTPMAAMLFDLPSHLEVATSFPVNAETLKWSARKLFRSKDDMRDPRMNLAGRSDLNGLPPVSIVLAEVDPLRSEGEALYDALRLSGTSGGQDALPRRDERLFRSLPGRQQGHVRASRARLAAFDGARRLTQKRTDSPNPVEVAPCYGKSAVQCLSRRMPERGGDRRLRIVPVGET